MYRYNFVLLKELDEKLRFTSSDVQVLNVQ